MNIKVLRLFGYIISILLLLLFLMSFVILRRNYNNDYALRFPKTALYPSYQKVKLPLTMSCGGGRLGNQLFRYACLYGLALKNNRDAQVPMCLAKYTSAVFETTLPIVDDPPKLNESERFQVQYTMNISKYYSIPEKKLVLDGAYYKNAYTFVDHVKEEIRKEFTFQKHLRDYSRKELLLAKGNRSNVTFVGVHVRRTDYPRHLKIKHQSEATFSYFLKAFNYYRGRFKQVIFVVASDDLTWCQENFPWEDVYVVKNVHPPEYDLAILSSCNHSIIDYGTFGWWGAFLAGGETTYYISAKEKELVDTGKVTEFLYLPEWHGFS